MQVRRVTSNDKLELARLILEFEVNTYLSEPQRKIRTYVNPQQMAQELAEEYSSPKHITFVAEDKGKLCGFACGEVKEKKYKVYNKEGYISDWFVEKEYRDHGVGKELFDSLVNEFKKLECTHIGLDTHLENKKAIEIYEHMGFTKRLVTFFKLLKDLP